MNSPTTTAARPRRTPAEKNIVARPNIGFRHPWMAAIRRSYPLIACASIVFTAFAIIIGQFGPDSYLDPLQITISEYAVADRGGVTEVAMVVMGLGSFALLGGMRAVGAPVRGLPEMLLLVWSGALIVAAIIPTTPVGHDLTTTALVHRYVSVAAFVSLPVAGALLVRRLAAHAQWKPVARPVGWMALAGGVGLLTITCVTLFADRALIGLVERFLLGAEAGLLAVLAVWLVRVTGGVRFAKAEQTSLDGRA